MEEITESLGLEPDEQIWTCLNCEEELGPATESYKEGCLVRSRNPRDVHKAYSEHPEYNFTPHPDWCRIVEFYCPNCGRMLENEYLPPGHPITDDISLDLDALQAATVE